MRRFVLLLLVLFVTTACAVQPSDAGPDRQPQPPQQPHEPGEPAPPQQPQDPQEPSEPEDPQEPAPRYTLLGTSPLSYQPDHASFPNPERGFHSDYSLAGGGPVRVATGQTLVRSYVRLDDWRYTQLPSSLLSDLQQGFDAVRQAGVKVIPRFTYNFGPHEDAPLESVLGHIAQLRPLLQRNADVIAVLQAGFIGRWGEWHHSTNGLDLPANKRIIGEALLAAMPQNRMVQIRTPYHIRHVLDSDEPFAAEQAFSGSHAARIGFVNDCFLAGRDDAGTFAVPLDYETARALTPFTVTGGETCAHPEADNRQECANALQELAAFSWDYLNADYYWLVLDRWHTGGCFGEIAQRLGYRFELLSSGLTVVHDELQLELELRNSGFGKLYNPRPLELVFVDVLGLHVPVTVQLTADARPLLPLSAETRSLNFSIRPELPPGQWELQLRLPDAAAELQQRPEYSIRLASLSAAGEPLWLAGTGSNRLGFVVQVPAD